MSDRPAIGFTVLTGFLGAGKTTTLNRLLGAGLGRRVAVLVNELGRIAIDTQLIVGRGGDVLELAGGCVCCKVGDDLWDGVADVARRSAPEHMVLETTGVAEPAAIIAGLAERPELLLAGVVCVVDARAGGAQLERHEEARAQVEAADRLLLTKLDVASTDEITALHRRLDRLAPTAERAAFPTGEELPLASWLLAPRPFTPAPHPPHTHDLQLAAATYVDAAPLLAEPLLAVVDGLRDRLVRVKGFVHLAGGVRGWLELAGGELRLEQRGEWGEGAPRTELVLIGDELDEAALRRRLHACRAG